MSLPGSASEADRALVAALYADFNARRIDPLLARMTPDVAWPSGMEGGYVAGREAVRAYWQRQWAIIDPQVIPQRVDADAEGRLAVTVRQVVRDLSGKVLKDDLIGHTYTREAGLISTMAIGPAPRPGGS